jgi:leucyl-tRNA synthetase
MKLVEFDEPFTKLFNQGTVIKDGAKMSKSFGNVVSQDEISQKYGIDAARLFLLFVASPESELEWSDEGIEGAYRFLHRIFSLTERQSHGSRSDTLIESKRNRTIKNVTGYIEGFSFNKAIIEIMEFANVLAKHNVSQEVFHDSLATLALLLCPFTPHIAEEMWEMLGESGFASTHEWPKVDEHKINDKVEQNDQYVEEIVSLTRKNVQLKKIEKPSSITLFQAEQWKYDFVRRFKKAFETLKNSGEIAAELLKDRTLATRKEEVLRLTGAVLKNMKLLPLVDRTYDEELQLLKSAVPVLQETFGCDVAVGEPTAPEPKAKAGLPGRPAVVLG